MSRWFGVSVLALGIMIMQQPVAFGVHAAPVPGVHAAPVPGVHAAPVPGVHAAPVPGHQV
jgi:hypothetical protein